MLGIVGPRFRKATSTYHSIEKYCVNHLWNARASQDVPGMYKVPNMFKLLPVMSEILLPLAQVKIFRYVEAVATCCSIRNDFRHIFGFLEPHFMAPDHRFFALPGISSYSPEKLRLETEGLKMWECRSQLLMIHQIQMLYDLQVVFISLLHLFAMYRFSCFMLFFFI